MLDAGEITGLHKGGSTGLWFCLMATVSNTLVVGDSVYVSQRSHDPSKQ